MRFSVVIGNPVTGHDINLNINYIDRSPGLCLNIIWEMKAGEN